MPDVQNVRGRFATAAAERRFLRTLLRKLARSGARVLGRLRYLRYFAPHPADRRIRIHCPEYVQPDPTERELVERLFCAFGRMKEDEGDVSPLYLPSTMWRHHLDEAFASLNAARAAGDPGGFHFFLANFGAWKANTGIESTTLVRANAGSELARRYLKREIFWTQLEPWQSFWGGSRPLAALSYPPIGNQAGAFIDGETFVGPGSFFNDIYGALLAELVRDRERPVIADLGAGYGKLAFFTLRDQADFVFLDFDLPEVLCTAAYYLMRAFPAKRALLYGEEPYSSASHERYDLIFMPGWVLERIGEDTVDLFVNKNSLGEMTADAARNYVGLIARAARYFFHMNHHLARNEFADGQHSLLGDEYPVPRDDFKLLFRYPELGHLLVQPKLGAESDIFVYLYERIGRRDGARPQAKRLSQ